MKIIKLEPGHELFPETLRTIPDPPQQIFVLGNARVLAQKPSLAVVGSRKITPYGRLVTRQLTGEVARAGVVIISGLALGVDAEAHQAALQNKGPTIAVLAGGLDVITPMTNYKLAQKILDQGGALVSEYPEGTPPQKISFVARNRLVSGLSNGVLITEAAAKSGTIHTANFALGQGRTVMAVPGNINSPYSEGTNNLIKAGALPVTDCSDIFLALGITTKQRHQAELFGGNEHELTILKLLRSGITDGSLLLLNSHLDAHLFNQTLTMLEITGKIYSLGAGHWALK